MPREHFEGQGPVRHGFHVSMGQFRPEARIGPYLCDQRPGGECDKGCWEVKAHKRARAITKALNQLANHEGCRCEGESVSTADWTPPFLIEIHPDSRRVVAERARRLGAAGLFLPFDCVEHHLHVVAVVDQAEVVIGPKGSRGPRGKTHDYFTHIGQEALMGEIVGGFSNPSNLSNPNTCSQFIEYALLNRPTWDNVAGFNGFWSDPRRRRCEIHGETWNHRRGDEGFECVWCGSPVKAYFTEGESLRADVTQQDIKSILSEFGMVRSDQGGGQYLRAFKSDMDPDEFQYRLRSRLPMKEGV